MAEAAVSMPNPDGWRTTTAAVALGVAGAAMFNLEPLFLAAASERFALTDSQIGVLAGVEIAGIALASALAPFWIHRTGYRRAALIGLAAIILGNVGSALVGDYRLLLVLRGLTGFAGDGQVYVAAILTLGGQTSPTRRFALLTFSNMLIIGAALHTLPRLSIGTTWGTVLGFIVLMALIAGAFVRSVPSTSCKPDNRRDHRGSWVALGALFAFCVNLGAIWAFAARIGAGIGLDIDIIGTLLGISMPLQAAGALFAALLGERHGRVLPLLLTLASQLAALGLLILADTGALYLTAIALWGMGWNFGLAYLLGLIAELDPGQRLLALAPATEAAGASLGPIVAGFLVLNGDYVGVIGLAAGATFISSLLAVAIASRQERSRHRLRASR